MPRKNFSLATLLSAVIVIVSTVFLCSLGVIFWNHERQSRLDWYRNHAKNNADQIATALSYPIWNYDEDYVKRIVNGVFQQSDIQAIRLTRTAQPELALVRSPLGGVSKSFADFIPTDAVAEIREIFYSGKTLGRVELYYATEELKEANRASLVFLIGLILGLNILLILVLYFFLWRWALAPLRRIEEYAQAVSSGEERASLSGRQFLGELESLRVSMERMVELQKTRLSEIAQSERKFHSIFNGTSDAIFLRRAFGPADAFSRIVEVNDVACEKLGYTRDELQQLTYEGLCLPSRGSRDETLPQPAGAGRHLARLRRKDGGEIPFEVLSQPIELEGCEYVISAGRDISEREAAEHERETLEEQLRQAHKMEAIGRLAGGIAHDFNNLLTAILGYCDLMEMDSVVSGDLGKSLQQIKSASNRAASLTQQLLAFSRKQILQPKRILLRDVVEETHKILERILGEDIDLVLKISPDVGFVFADPGQMSQVLMNLTINARDAMPEGGRLTIEVANVTLDEADALKQGGMSPGPYVKLSITDTGMGMDSVTQEKLFEPFFTTKGVGKGTGLGLATVHGIVTQSGGFLTVNSVQGKGTTFHLFFPQSLSGDADEAVPTHGLETLRGGTETLLLVEDSPEVRGFAAGVLRSLGYTVHEASRGEEAEAFAAEFSGHIDLLLTDVVMPGISGRVLAERLAASRLGLRILYMSGYTENAIVHHGVLEKGLLFIQKPFKTSELAAKVREALSS